MVPRQLELLYRVRGYLLMLQDCCDGRNVHRVGNLKVALLLTEGLLDRHDLDCERLDNVEIRVRELAPKVKQLYSEWWTLQQRVA